MQYFADSDGFVKFVKTEDGKYHFCENMANHSDLVRGSAKAKSAGFVSWYTTDGQKFLKISNEWSMTLMLGPDQEDGPAIANLVGFKFVAED